MMENDLVDRVWFTGHGDPRTFSDVIEKTQTEIVIGTDSHRQGSRKRVFATAICPEADEFGRRYFWSRRSVPKKMVGGLRGQLFMEAMQSIEVAMTLVDQSPLLIPQDITIHVDCSPDESKHRSGLYAKTLLNMVKAYGFKCVLKPDNPWAASGVADRHAR